MRALGLIVSQGETEHMLSALQRLTFQTILSLWKNHVYSETRTFEVFAKEFQFYEQFFNYFGQIFVRNMLPA